MTALYDRTCLVVKNVIFTVLAIEIGSLLTDVKNWANLYRIPMITVYDGLQIRKAI
jgi:hypothetical protein